MIQLLFLSTLLPVNVSNTSESSGKDTLHDVSPDSGQPEREKSVALVKRGHGYRQLPGQFNVAACLKPESNLQGGDILSQAQVQYLSQRSKPMGI